MPIYTRAHTHMHAHAGSPHTHTPSTSLSLPLPFHWEQLSHLSSSTLKFARTSSNCSMLTGDQYQDGVYIYGHLNSKIVSFLHVSCVTRSSGIGVWYDVMSMMVFIAILTNSAILGFSSEQLMQWLPYLFTRDTAGGDQVMALGSGRYISATKYDIVCLIHTLSLCRLKIYLFILPHLRYVVGIVVVFEHLLLLVAILLMKSINPVPKWVRIAIDRRKYLSQQRLKQQGATASDLVETMK